jgi:hypothetical protein
MRALGGPAAAAPRVRLLNRPELARHRQGRLR